METLRLATQFSTFLECSQMSGVFYHSVIHGSNFFICFMIFDFTDAQNNKSRFSYLLYSDKTCVFDQSERAQGRIYIINSNKLVPVLFDKNSNSRN